MSKPVLHLSAIERTYVTEAGELPVLRGAELELHPGEIVGLVGPSGSGKSSLLHAAGLLERPDGGEVFVRGQATSAMTDRMRTALRRSDIGFVYQFHQLLPEFDALENVVLPQLIGGAGAKTARERGEKLLTQLGLKERLSHSPAQLSGGEQQRVAIARGLANNPSILLADEPTGNLDPATSEAVFDALRNLVREEGAAALIATHNHALADRMDRVMRLEAGQLVELEKEAEQE